MAFGLPAGISPNPSNGTPTVNIEGITGPRNGTQVASNDKTKYGSWNGDWFGYLQYMADNGDSAALDKILNYVMTTESERSAREWTAQREDTQYQRLIADMKAAGINPYALLSNGGSFSPISSAAQSHSYSGTNNATYEIQKEKNAQNWLKVALSSALPIIGGIIAAFL